MPWPFDVSALGRDEFSEDQHAVAVGEEAVALADGVGVGGENRFPSRKSADEHQKRGLWQMEVGKKTTDYAEAIAGADEDTSLA